jgi:hypothetical protein
MSDKARVFRSRLSDCPLSVVEALAGELELSAGSVAIKSN